MYSRSQTPGTNSPGVSVAPGQMFGPRHSSPTVLPFASPRPPNVGPITAQAPVLPVQGPNLNLFSAPAPTPTGVIPWGSGALVVGMQVPPNPVAVQSQQTTGTFQGVKVKQEVPKELDSPASDQHNTDHHRGQSDSDRRRRSGSDKGRHGDHSRSHQSSHSDRRSHRHHSFDDGRTHRDHTDRDHKHSSHKSDRRSHDDRKRERGGRDRDGRLGHSGAVLLEDRDDDDEAHYYDDRHSSHSDTYDKRNVSRDNGYRRNKDGNYRSEHSGENHERRRHRDSERGGRNSGAILLDDRDYDDRIGIDCSTKVGSSHRGTLLLEDREDVEDGQGSRHREDRGGYRDSYGRGRDRRGHSGDGDRAYGDKGRDYKDNDWYHERDSAYFDRSSGKHDRHQGHQHKGRDHSHRGQGHLHKGQGHGHSHHSGHEKGYRDSADKKGHGARHDHYGDRAVSRGSGVSVEQEMATTQGRTGAILIEDWEEDRPVLREDRDPVGTVGRTGALLLDDRYEDKTADKHWEEPKVSRGQHHKGHPVCSDSREGSEPKIRGHSRGRSTQRSLDRPSISLVDSQGLKRSRSSNQRSERSCERTSRERDERPVGVKRRRREKIVDDPPVIQCVRSGTPPVTDEDTYVEPVAAWVRCSAADLYFRKDPQTGNLVTTKRMQELENKFEHDLVMRGSHARAQQEPPEKPRQMQPRWQRKHMCQDHHHHKHDHGKESSSSASSDSDSESDSEEWWMEELRRKQDHPYRLHKELWYNDPGELNYGPLCRCSLKSRKTGIRHDIYPGEQPVPRCDLNSNNMNKLHHYKITVSPVTNFLTKHPTIIMFDGHEYMFEGFSVFTHQKVPKLPPCQVIRFNIIYTIHIIEEEPPENFSVRSLDLLSRFLFDEILELVDVDWKGVGGECDCRRFHVMPRFARPFPENGKEILSMNDVLLYLLKSSKPLLEPLELSSLLRLDDDGWQKFVDSFRHMVVTCPGKKPSAIRIDQLDRQDCEDVDKLVYPLIIHHGLRPAQLSYAGDPVYKKKWREYMKFRHLVWCKTKLGIGDKEKLEEFEMELQKIRLSYSMKREVTVEIDSEGFLLTGIRADICQHAMLLPVLFGHIRFHECLAELERKIDYTFKDKTLLQLAMTHSSYKINYGTNHDHGRNSLSNCGSRQREFGDHRALTQHTRKRGLNILLRIMSKFGNKSEVRSDIPHNERLEFLGDAVVEFITSIHLFYMFPYADEGEMTMYRGSLVQNGHLAILADKLRLQDFLLYAHGPDLCHDSALKHAMANCFEALMGALYLDGGIKLADKVFSRALFMTESDLLDIWTNVPDHPLIMDEPNGDRHWIANSPALQKLLIFEKDIGYEFRHIRLLAKSLTQRNVGYNHLTLGHNQRLEFLGDTIMQLISSNFLYRHFPDHHEGHLTLLRSSLVNNKTQSIVAEELGLTDYVINAQKCEGFRLRQKEKADLLEALLGAMYVDGGLEPCSVLCGVCIFPRLEQFILNQDWNDPKSQLQQCCLTLRDMNEESPAIPVYKVLKKSGPANTRTYKVGVYFRGKRLAVGQGGSIQQGEMDAAETALSKTKGLFHNRFRFSEKMLKTSLLKQEVD